MLSLLVLSLALAAFWLFGLSAIFQSALWSRSHLKGPAYNVWVRSLKLLADATGGNRSAVKPLLSQLNAGVLLAMVYTGKGAAIMDPTAATTAVGGGIGDPNLLWLQANTRQAVGKFTLKTKDSWLNIVWISASYGAATLTNYWIINFGIPTQNADNTWSVTMQFYGAAGAAAPALVDPIAGDLVWLSMLMRNSLLNP